MKCQGAIIPIYIMHRKNTIRQLLSLMLISAVAAVLPSAAMLADNEKKTAVAATTNISITLPDFIILHYYSGLTLNFEQFSSAVDQGSADFDVQWSGTAESNSARAEENTVSQLPARITIQMPNVWAVRGLSPSGSAMISIEITNSDIISGTSIISMADGSGNIEIDDNSGHSGTTINTNLNGIGTDTATIGNVRITLDFSRTTRAGLHTGGQYKITAETI